jgi:hypothetical protein
MTRSRIGGFEGFHRRIAGSGRSRIVPCCDARSVEIAVVGGLRCVCDLARSLC